MGNWSNSFNDKNLTHKSTVSVDIIPFESGINLL